MIMLSLSRWNNATDLMKHFCRSFIHRISQLFNDFQLTLIAICLSLEIDYFIIIYLVIIFISTLIYQNDLSGDLKSI